MGRIRILRPATFLDRRLHSYLGKSLASERFDQWFIRPHDPQDQLVPGIRKRIIGRLCLGDTPVDRGLSRVKSTRQVF